MPHIIFTPNLRRHVECEPHEVSGSTVRAVLNSAFVENAKLRGYVLDDQDRLRQHVTIFIDGQPIHDRDTLSDVVAESAEVFVMQALSGG